MLMPPWILPLSANMSEQQVGRKAATLGRLLSLGFPVPGGVCITTTALQTLTAASTNLSLPDELRTALADQLPQDSPLAVRSSAVNEDAPDASQAGRFLTRLNVVRGAALEAAILDCWRSYLTAPATHATDGMAILIQPMIPAECAGVCFTVDPVQERPDRLLVVSGWGLGAGIVSGVIPADTHRLLRFDLQTYTSVIAEKHTGLYPAAQGGVERRAVPAQHQSIPCLPAGWLQRVGQYGLTIEQALGAPQDIEWAIADGQLWILQSRPITTLSASLKTQVNFPVDWHDADERRRYWWLERSADPSGAPLLPAELDCVRFSTLGGQDSVYYAGLETTRYRKALHGRIYMSAAASPHASGHVRVYAAAQRDLHNRLAHQDVTIWEHWGPEVVAAVRRVSTYDPAGKDQLALAEHLENAAASAVRSWMVHTLVGPRPIRSNALLDVYSRLTRKKPEAAAVDIPFLLAGTETIQTRLVEALYDLACLALGHPQAAQAITFGQRHSLSQVNTELAAFEQTLQNLLVDYGGRLCHRPAPGYVTNLPLPWREAPQHVWGLIAAYLPLARQGAPAPRQNRLAALAAAEEQVENICKSALAAGREPDVVQDFRRALRYARRSAVFLDEHNHYIDQLADGEYLQALLYAGRWLAGRGLLRDVLDVYWLYTDEVLAALHDPSMDLSPILAQRRAQYAQWQAVHPPACVGLPNPDLPERAAIPTLAVFAEQTTADGQLNRLKGESASRGLARGRARRSNGETLPENIEPGDILILPYAGAALIPLLPAVAAVVLDYSNPGDHFAITAREFGLPAVCATLHATRRIPEGAWVRVDASNGIVTWE